MRGGQEINTITELDNLETVSTILIFTSAQKMKDSVVQLKVQ